MDLRQTSLANICMSWAAIAALSLAMLLSYADKAAANDAETFVQGLADEAISILSNEALSVDEREAGFRKLFSENADLEKIGTFVLGPYARKMRSENLMDEYQAVFKDYVVAIYAGRFSGYSGQTFDVNGSAIKNNEAIVQSVINLTDGNEPIKVNWRLTKNSGYKVIDVQVAGIWMAVEQRDQFTSYINNNGRDVKVLVDFLKTKI